MIEQVKGVNFSVTAFLGETPPPAPSSATQKNLQYVVVYLAPGDYHRFHSPTAWSINELRHFPGTKLVFISDVAANYETDATCHIKGQMYSVSPALVSVFKDLFVLNERAVLLGNWAHGFFAMAPVAATNVGNIHLNFQPVISPFSVALFIQHGSFLNNRTW